MPLAPGLFSMMTGCFSESVSFCATRREIRSLGPPGAKGTMMRIVRFG
jgi:hypothetical protein